MIPAWRWRGAWALPWLLGGCAVDLWVGEPAGAEASDGTSAASEGGTTIAPPSDDTSVSTTTGPEPEVTTTSTEGGTVALEEGTTTSGPVDEEGTTTSGPGEEEGTTTSVEIPCAGLSMLDCNELGDCLWYGTEELGECAPSPCEDPKHDCWFFGFEACEAAFACAWVGEMELGECGPIECVPCEVLTADQCVETPTCTLGEGELCLPA